jgi:hypothetical protein
MSKKSPQPRHLFPADNNSNHVQTPGCPCRPATRIRVKPVPTLLYIHNPMPHREGPAR